MTLLAIVIAAVFMFTACPKAGEPEAKEKVKLSFHVMSKCPYGAQVVLGVKPALDKLGNAVDFELNYIGNEKDGKWLPMHGEPELKGDKIAVCAKKHLPLKYMDLVDCMAKDFRKIPSNLDSCIAELKVDGAKIKACADGEEGTKLIEESYKLSVAKGATGSPTIYLNDQPYQGGRTGNDFLRSICEKYTTAKPKACSEIPEPSKVKVTMISDKRCPQCQAERLVQNLKGIFPGLEAEILYYDVDEKGKTEYQKYAAKGHNLLPLIVFDAETVEKDEGYDKIQKWIQKVDNKLILRVGAKFDPTKEICDNNIDDTGNGKIDCDDEDCKDELVCRKEIKKKLDVFVMSQCPYGTMALDAMEEVLEMFKEDKIDFNINFIATETEPGKFQSLHGQPEVDENIREICAIKYYPKNYMDYILCRNKNIRSNEWKECAKGAIKADVIDKCFTGPEGAKLLGENVKIANAMAIGGSPTWIINNKHKASGVAAADIQRNLCAHNAELKGCAKTVKPQDKPAPKGGCGD